MVISGSQTLTWSIDAVDAPVVLVKVTPRTVTARTRMYRR